MEDFIEGIDPSILEIIREQDKKGGLNLTLLEVGTKLTVETKNSIYEFKIVEGREVTIMGGMTRDGEIRFPRPEPAIFVGSTWGGSMLKPDWLGEDMSMEIVLPNEVEERQVLTTSRVRNVEVEAPDAAWSYSMDWGKA